VVGPVRVGRNCAFYQGVTLGKSVDTLDNPDFKSLVPTLGDGVWVLPGAVIAGGVTVGDNAAVSANSLVVRDVPPGGVMLGVPARLVSRRGGSGPDDVRENPQGDERNAASADAEAGTVGRDSHGRGAEHGSVGGSRSVPDAVISRQDGRGSL
jgi:serine acetyltransferase